MTYLRKYIKKYGKWFSVAVLFLTVEAACELMLPILLARIIDNGIAFNQMDIVWELGGIMLLITAIGALAACGRNIMASRVSQAFGTELRSDLFRKIQSLSFESMDRFDRASLITRLTNDVTQVQNFTNGLMRIFVKAPMICVGSMIMAVRLNMRLSVVLLVVVPIVALLIAWNMRIGLPRYKKVQQAMDRMNLVLREYLSGVRVVKAFNRFGFEVDKMEQANLEFQTRSVQVMRLMAAFNPATMLTINAGILAILWVGGLSVNQGNMPVGHIVAFINYMTQILFSLMMISLVFMMFVRARASSERVAEVFADEDSMVWNQEQLNPVEGKGKLEFQSVNFTYNKREQPHAASVLKNISFVCEPGETVGLIGSTGSGKSSLVNLIPRFYDVDSGVVRIGGADISKLNPRVLRETIAIVPQKSVLFTGTIRENILWGKQDATDEQLYSAAAIAAAHDFITGLADGYETVVGQKGVNLSGGQKQRISIARALVREPDILILDDSTSAVDVVTEAGIKEALKAYSKPMTCLIIAQRITSVMDADQIIVLEQGEIVGIGKHANLIRSCRVYREIYASQAGKEALPDAEEQSFN